MSAPTPATLPDLLRAGTGVRWRDEETRYVVTAPPFPDADDAMWVIAAPCTGIPLGVQDDPSNFTLDLDSPTTRAHLAWWILAQPGMHVYTAFSSPATLTEVLRCACGGRGLSPDDVAILTTVARHLAGLEPA